MHNQCPSVSTRREAPGVMALARVVTWVVVSSTLADQKITVSDDASNAAGDGVNGPPDSVFLQASLFAIRTPATGPRRGKLGSLDGESLREVVAMCGPTSAIGLEDHERLRWAQVKEALRQPGHLAGLMRGFLAGSEVAVVIATAPDGRVRPLAVIVTPVIAEEIVLPDESEGAGWVPGRIGDYPAEIWTAGVIAGGPTAVRVTPWMHEHLALYARQLWSHPARHSHVERIS